MKILHMLPILGLLTLIPGDSSGFPYSGAPRPGAPPRPAPPRPIPVRPVAPRPVAVSPVAIRPVAPRPIPAPIHTPALVVPAPVRPVVNPHPVVVRPNPVPVRPIITPHPVVAPVRPPVVIGPRPVTPVIRPTPYVRPYVGIGNRPVVIQPALIARGVNFSRPSGVYRPGYAYYHDWHTGWHHGYWSGWYQRPWLWFGSGVAVGWMFPPVGSVTYWNPYYVVPPTVTVYNYAQPIPVPEPIQIATNDPSGVESAPIPNPPTNVTSSENVAAAAKLLESARQAFAARDYEKAQPLIDRAVSLSTNDTALHEFRALVLFARQKYQDATATIYAVLAVGPGWDWETLRSQYPDSNTYKDQLRMLEAFAQANPKDAGARFLLAYHYLILDARDAAAKMLRNVVELQPKDQLASHLLQMLEKKPELDRPTPGM